MSDMKCPFCNGKLEQVFIHGIQGWACTKLECKGYFMTATKDMWQELIRTRKALDVAVGALKEMADWYPDVCDKVAETLDEITALEQKDAK